MIIGNGLLAKSLTDADRDDVIFFCSGVSNSLETNPLAFAREAELIGMQDAKQLLVYFSTISIFNPAKQNSPYTQHKKAMEQLVSTQFANHIIVRLPNVVGQGGNGSNLLPYFLHGIAENKPVIIFENTRRELMEASVLPNIVNTLLEMGFRGSINAGFSHTPMVLDIYLHLCDLMEATPNYTLTSGELSFETDCSEFIAIMESAGVAPAGTWQDMAKRAVELFRGQPA